MIALRSVLKKTSESFQRLFWQKGKGDTITEEFYSELVDVLILADVGVGLSEKIVAGLKRDVNKLSLLTRDDARKRLIHILVRMLSVEPRAELYVSGLLNIYLFAGVNGVGKTTFLAKFASRLIKDGFSVISACGDTFRAAAGEQLSIWGERVGFPVVTGETGQDPASVVFKAVERAIAEKRGAVLIDTAGRMQTKKNLMDELGKISRSTRKALSRYSPYIEGSTSNEVNFLVLDATTGQNAVEQAKIFSEAVSINGIVLNKMDGTAKGGVIFPVVDATRVPVLFLGCGEKIEDILDFNPEDFVANLLGE